MYIVFNVFVNENQEFDLSKMGFFNMCYFVCTLSVVFFIKLYFLGNASIINQLTNLQTIVHRACFCFVFIRFALVETEWHAVYIIKMHIILREQTLNKEFRHDTIRSNKHNSTEKRSLCLLESTMAPHIPVSLRRPDPK